MRVPLRQFFSLVPQIDRLLSPHDPAMWYSLNSPLMLTDNAKLGSHFMTAVCGTQKPKLMVKTRPHSTTKLELYPKIYSGHSGVPCTTLLAMVSRVGTLLPIESNGLLAK